VEFSFPSPSTSPVTAKKVRFFFCNCSFKYYLMLCFIVD
jgi:hypothetical protein